jgi:hypothetical protein
MPCQFSIGTIDVKAGSEIRRGAILEGEIGEPPRYHNTRTGRAKIRNHSIDTMALLSRQAVSSRTATRAVRVSIFPATDRVARYSGTNLY